MDIRKHRNALLLAAAVAVVGMGVVSSRMDQIAAAQAMPKQTYTQLMTQARGGQIASVLLAPGAVLAKTRDGKEFVTVLPEDAHPSDQLVGYGVDVGAAGKPRPGRPVVAAVLVSAAADALLPLHDHAFRGRAPRAGRSPSGAAASGGRIQPRRARWASPTWQAWIRPRPTWSKSYSSSRTRQLPAPGRQGATRTSPCRASRHRQDVAGTGRGR